VPTRVEQLTSAIASGDTEAFAVFYETYFDAMLREAGRTTRLDEAFCLDVVHDACLRIIKSMSAMESEGQLMAWLKRVITSCAVDRLRAETRRRRREHEAARRRAEAATEHADDADAERLAWLRERLDELDGSQKRLLHQRFALERTLEGIGRALGMGPGAVDGRIRRTLGAMRSNAKEQFNDV
jgi:RNA polymerase sigma factor (sigma-70 family)